MDQDSNFPFRWITLSSSQVFPVWKDRNRVIRLSNWPIFDTLDNLDNHFETLIALDIEAIKTEKNWRN